MKTRRATIITVCLKKTFFFQDLNRCIDKIELVDYHQVLEHEGIKFWCYNAGHVLGAAMFMIEIAVGKNCACSR